MCRGLTGFECSSRLYKIKIQQICYRSLSYTNVKYKSATLALTNLVCISISFVIYKSIIQVTQTQKSLIRKASIQALNRPVLALNVNCIPGYVFHCLQIFLLIDVIGRRICIIHLNVRLWHYLIDLIWKKKKTHLQTTSFQRRAERNSTIVTNLIGGDKDPLTCLFHDCNKSLTNRDFNHREITNTWCHDAAPSVRDIIARRVRAAAKWRKQQGTW